MLTLERVMARSFGDVVRSRRAELGLTQQQVAQRVGVDPGWVSKVERDKASDRLPETDTFLAWASALETTPEWLLSQMGYIGNENRTGEKLQPELVFTSLAEEIRSAELPSDVQESMLDGVKHARRLWEARQRSSKNGQR